MAKPSLTVLQKSYLKRIDALQNNNKSFRDLLSTVQQTGDNYVAQKRRLEDKVFDEKWVEELELGFASLDRILANPRKFIKEEEEVVLAALAKRITSASIVHLASHTQFVHSVDANGNVTPERILSVSTEEDIQIYENRFVMSLIQKLAIFIEKRYQFIRSHGETRNSDVLLIHSKTEIDGVCYEVDNRIKISVPSSDNGLAEKNDQLLKKIANLRERVVYYLHSPFMEQMKDSKPVHNPIAMTNMLLKNPDYHKAYELWRFIDNYEKLGVTYSVKETNQTFDNAYFKEIYSLIVANMLTLKAHEIEGKGVEAPAKTKRKVLEPRTLLSLDDETFLDGRFAYDQFPELKALIEPQASLAKKEGEERLAPTPEMVRLMREMAAEKIKRDLIKAKEIRDRQQALRDKQEREEAEQAVLRKKKLDELVAKAQLQEAAIRKKEEERRLRDLALQKAKEAQEAFEREQKLLEQARNEILKAASSDRIYDKKIAEELEAKETAEKIIDEVEEKTIAAPIELPVASEVENVPQVTETVPQNGDATPSVILQESPLAQTEADLTSQAVTTPDNTELPSGGTVPTEALKTPEMPFPAADEAISLTKEEASLSEPVKPNPLDRSKVLLVLEKAERAIPAAENKPVLVFSTLKNSKPGEVSPSGVKRVSLATFAIENNDKNPAKTIQKQVSGAKEEPKPSFVFAFRKEPAKPQDKLLAQPTPSPKKGFVFSNAKPKIENAAPTANPAKKIFLAKNDEEKRK